MFKGSCFALLVAMSFSCSNLLGIDENTELMEPKNYISRISINNKSDFTLHVVSHQSNNEHRTLKGIGTVDSHNSHEIEISTSAPDTVDIQVNYDLNGHAGRIIIAEWIHQHKIPLQTRRFDNPDLRVDYDSVYKTLNVRNKRMFT